MGLWMDTPESINEESIQSFYQAPSYHMEDYPPPQGGWKTFNEFFARYIDPAKRPIGSPADDSVIVSPADCTFDGTWPVESPSVEITTFDVKGVPWAISQLLDDFKLGPMFAGGVFTHSFLGPSDYHRQHAPVAGKVVDAKVIPGICYLEVIFSSRLLTGVACSLACTVT
jgi:phosphatidylserine decarboxylase